MKNDKKQDILIDAISGIDEDIIDKNLEKRFKLWSKNGSKRNLYVSIISVAAALCLIFSGVLIYLIGNPSILPNANAPVYEGMTVETMPPIALKSNELGIMPLSENHNNTFAMSMLSSDTSEAKLTDSSASNTLGTVPSSDSAELEAKIEMVRAALPDLQGRSGVLKLTYSETEQAWTLHFQPWSKG